MFLLLCEVCFDLGNWGTKLILLVM